MPPPPPGPKIKKIILKSILIKKLNSGVPINMPKINEEFCTILEGGWGVQKSLSRREPSNLIRHENSLHVGTKYPCGECDYIGRGIGH